MIFQKVILFIDCKLEIWFPIITYKIKYGVNPMMVEKNIDILETFNVAKKIFWTKSGGPMISLNKIKYSKDDFLIIFSNTLKYWLIYLSKYLFNIFFDKIIKNKLPNDTESMFIRKA